MTDTQLVAEWLATHNITHIPAGRVTCRGYDVTVADRLDSSQMTDLESQYSGVLRRRVTVDTRGRIYS
jgi:hypothetical protein